MTSLIFAFGLMLSAAIAYKVLMNYLDRPIRNTKKETSALADRLIREASSKYLAGELTREEWLIMIEEIEAEHLTLRGQ